MMAPPCSSHIPTAPPLRSPLAAANVVICPPSIWTAGWPRTGSRLLRAGRAALLRAWPPCQISTFFDLADTLLVRPGDVAERASANLATSSLPVARCAPAGSVTGATCDVLPFEALPLLGEGRAGGDQG